VNVGNHSSIYAPSKNKIEPRYTLFHVSDSMSEVHFTIKASKVLFSKKPNEENFKSSISLVVRHLENIEEQKIIDSLYLTIDQVKLEGESFIYGHFQIKTPLEFSVLDLKMVDNIARTENNTFLEVDRSNGASEQNYLFVNDDNMPVIDNLSVAENVKVYFNNPDISTLYCKLYGQKFPLALPPFSVYDYQPTQLVKDTIIELLKKEDYFQFQPFSSGLYQISIDTSQSTGRANLAKSQSYPHLSTMADLIPPMRYITTKKEYNDLVSENTKEALDNFWLRVGTNEQKAHGLFRSYYQRVQDANMYFSTYTEGWKTDRGMIYIVFGSPNIIYKSKYSENWIYGEENNFMSLNFTFKKVENPLSDNDFSLSRSSIYKSSYYKAVDSWRQGRILN
jgi:GWxTD domain-containing protein